jgi:hypothetical protein
MAMQSLNVTDAGTVLNEMSGKGAAEAVNRDFLVVSARFTALSNIRWAERIDKGVAGGCPQKPVLQPP